jgi:hypothetical protein
MAEKPNLADVKTYFLEFIRTEEIGLKNEEQGDWYPSNWHRPANNLALAAKALSEEDLLRVYQHKIRLGAVPCKEVKTNYALFIKAYAAYLIWLKSDHAKTPWIASGARFKLQFIYGFDYQTIINQNDSFDDGLLFASAFKQYTNYAAIPYMLKKPHMFYPLATNEKVVNRAIAALEAVEFMRDSDFVMMHSGLYGALFTLLLSPYAQAKTCYNRFQATLALAGNDAQHAQRVEEYLPRFEEVAKNYLN